MIDKIKQFIDYLEEEVQKTVEEEKLLIQDEKKDEANLAKIKNNILGIAKTVFAAITKNKSCKEEEIRALFMEKMETIPKNWRSSYENAKIHNDVEKILIEEIKLQTLDMICNKFKEIWGEQA